MLIFKDIDKASCSSLIIDISNYWNNGINSYDQLKELTRLSHATVRTYLKKACENNYITESYNDVLRKIRCSSNKKIAASKSYRIICDQTGELFCSIKEAARKTGVTNIRDYLSGKYTYAGKLSDGTKLTWTKISNEQYEQMLSKEHSNIECSFLM